ncbi:hypothetical protein K2X33_14040 [bacterium]|nr:hypothetical protein [bacterium]
MKYLSAVSLTLLLALSAAQAGELPSDDKNWEDMGHVTFDGSGRMYTNVDLKGRQAGDISFRIPSYCTMVFDQVVVTNELGEAETLTLDSKLTRDDGQNLFVTYHIDGAYAYELKDVAFAMDSESDESGCDAHVFLTSDYVGVR